MRPTVRATLSPLAALLLGLVWLFVIAEPAAACSCAASTTAERVQRADTIISGTVLSQHQSTERLLIVAVRRVYKGELAAEQVTVRPRSRGGCGLGAIPNGARYVFFLNGDAATGLRAGPCAGSAPATTGLIGKLQRLLGDGSPPPAPAPPAMPEFTAVPGGEPTSVGRSVAPGLALALVGGLGLALLRDRRRVS